MDAPSKPIQLDWHGYWKAFQVAHGSNPVPYKGKLLFSDGWTYSATDHAGPEWPPPADPAELYQLQRAYWSARRQIVEEQRQATEEQLRQLKAMQAIRSVPLQRVTQWWDREARVMREDRGTVDLAEMENRLRWLDQDVQACDAELQRLAAPAGAGSVAGEP